MQDILGSVEVGVENNSTCLASEDRALPLSFSQTSANGAGLGCVLGWNSLDSNTNLKTLISEELLQLVERPVRELPILASPVLCIPDSVQFLQDDYSILSCTNYQFTADAVVDITHETSLPATHLFEMPLGRVSAFACQSTTKTNITILDFPDMLAVHKPAIGSRYQIVYASVYSDCTTSLVRESIWLLHCYHQPEFSISAFDEIAFLSVPISIFTEILADAQFDFDTTIKSEDADNTLLKVDCATPFVIVDGLPRELGLASFSSDRSLDRSTGIFVGTDSQLCWQPKVLSEIGIRQVMHSEGVAFLGIIAGINDIVLSFGHSIESIIKTTPLSGIFKKYSLNSFHHITISCLQGIKRTTENSAIPPTPEGRGFPCGCI
jgi:hypothetical protein